MDFMQCLKNYNRKRSIDKANMKICMMTTKILIKMIMIFNKQIEKKLMKNIFKETIMLIKHLIHNLNLNQEDLIMVYKYKDLIYLIMIYKSLHYYKFLSVGQQFQLLISYNKKSKKSKRNKSLMLIKRKEMHSLWLLKGFKQKVKERRNKVKEEFFKKTFMSKIKNNQLKKLFQEKTQKSPYQGLRINYLASYNKQDI